MPLGDKNGSIASMDKPLMGTSISEPKEGHSSEVFISLALDEQEKMSNAINMILKEV